MVKSIYVLFILPLILCDSIPVQPVYKYRYETEDIMKTAASNIPVGGYRVVEGGYYPSNVERGKFGFSGPGILEGLGAYSGQIIGPSVGHVVPMGAAFGGQALPQYQQGGLVGAGPGFGGLQAGFLGGFPGGFHNHFPHQFGGEEVIKEAYSGGEKNLNDGKFEKSEGKKGEEAAHGKSGFVQGQASAKDVKGDAGYYTNVDGEKKVHEDGKEYQGGQHYNKEGKSGEEKTAKQGHKKGHKIKSFKNSHHKDESGKNEEFYDEAHDEGGNYVFNGQAGSFGENGGSAFKGANQDTKYNTAEAKKEGHFENKQAVDKVESDQGKYGENKFAENGALFGVKSGTDEQSLLGHQESSKFIKSHPFVIPFYQP